MGNSGLRGWGTIGSIGIEWGDGVGLRVWPLGRAAFPGLEIGHHAIEGGFDVIQGHSGDVTDRVDRMNRVDG